MTAAPSFLFCHQRREFPQDLRHLIEIVGTAALQGHQLLDRGKVYMENVAVERHLPHIGPGVGDPSLGHPRMDGGQFVLCNHYMKMDILVLCQEKVQIKYALLMLSYPAKASALSSNAA